MREIHCVVFAISSRLRAFMCHECVRVWSCAVLKRSQLWAPPHALGCLDIADWPADPLGNGGDTNHFPADFRKIYTQGKLLTLSADKENPIITHVCSTPSPHAHPHLHTLLLSDSHLATLWALIPAGINWHQPKIQTVWVLSSYFKKKLRKSDILCEPEQQFCCIQIRFQKNSTEREREKRPCVKWPVTFS